MALETKTAPAAIRGVNDFVVKFANVNGSGSASANGLFAKSVLRMGIPVSSRNSFPSNIQGVPTWFEVRMSESGHLGGRGGVDMMVAMTPQTWEQDIAEIEPGGYLLYDATKPMPASRFRDDINIIGAPLTEICNRTYDDARQRKLFKNIIYLGVLSALLDMDVPAIEQLIGEQFRGKDTLIKPNLHALQLGRDWAQEALDCPRGLHLERRDKVGDRIFVSGNDAAALGAVYGGATVCAWYPITPSSSLAEAFQAHCQRLRRDPESKDRRYAIIQAEDELASIGIVIGAAWNGARAFTATSGPGISLMQEFLGLAYFAEIPSVIFDLQRAGPSTGLPTPTQQCHFISCAYASQPGTHRSKGYFSTRRTSRDRYARYTEEGAAYADNMQRLLRKFETAKDQVPRPLQATAAKPTKYGVIYYGSTSPAMDEAIHIIEARGHSLNRLRVRAFPFHSRVTSFVPDPHFVFVVEQNRDAQLRSLIVNECSIDPVRLVPILHYDGTPITARFIARAIGDHLDALKVTPLRKVVS